MATDTLTAHDAALLDPGTSVSNDNGEGFAVDGIPGGVDGTGGASDPGATTTPPAPPPAPSDPNDPSQYVTGSPQWFRAVAIQIASAGANSKKTLLKTGVYAGLGLVIIIAILGLVLPSPSSE